MSKAPMPFHKSELQGAEGIERMFMLVWIN